MIRLCWDDQASIRRRRAGLEWRLWICSYCVETHSPCEQKEEEKGEKCLKLKGFS